MHLDTTQNEAIHKNNAIKEASIIVTYWRFTIPAITAMLVNGLYQLVDGIFLGQYVGADGLAAINTAWPITTFVSGLGLMLGMGAGSLISLARGEGNWEKARSAMVTGLLLCFGLGILGTGYLAFFSQPLIALQNATANVSILALEYIKPFIWTAPLTVLAGALPFLIRNDESPLIATSMLVLGAFLNIFLDYLFIGIFQWALFGAALATVLAQLAIVLSAAFYFCSAYSLLRIFSHPLKWCFIKAQKTLVGGASSLVMFMYYGILVAVHNRLFAQYGSPTSVASFAIIGYLMTLFYVVAEGIGEGLQPQVSYYQGAQKYQPIKKVVMLASVVSFSVGMIWLGVLNLFPAQIIHFFDGKDNPSLITEAILGIRLHLSAMSLDGLIIIASMYFLSIGRGSISLCIAIANMFIQFPFLAILPFFWGLEGVWLAMPLSTIFLAIIVVPYMWYHILTQGKNTSSSLL